jgi:VWFA-related protein
MRLPLSLLLVSLAGVTWLATANADEPVVFKSDVSLVRVDTQVLDRDNRAITGLVAEDFVLREEGRPQPIRNFANENMPLDVLMLFDVSASMRPHIQRIASAAHEAFRALGTEDRVGIMVFDRSSRLRLPFRKSHDDVEREMDRLLRDERFNGGTDITRGLLDAADYVKSSARKDARRAIVIVTDDETEFDRDEERVSRALIRADAVLSALIAPDAMQNRRASGSGYPGGGSRRRTGSTWPGGGGGIGLPGGGTWPGGGGRGGNGGGRYPGGVGGGSRTHSAGTSEIARDSGGDSMHVDDADGLETTLSRIRQRYALHFLAPPGNKEERNIEVALTSAARSRYPDAEIRYRKTYLAPRGSYSEGAAASSTEVTQTAPTTGSGASADATDSSSNNSGWKRRRAVNDVHDGPSAGPQSTETPRTASQPDPPRVEQGTPLQQDAPPPVVAPKKGGWRRVDDPSSESGPKPDSTPKKGNNLLDKTGYSLARLKPE